MDFCQGGPIARVERKDGEPDREEDTLDEAAGD